jgi:hypothetical protein
MSQSLENEVASLRSEVEVLKRQVNSLRRAHSRLDQLVDTINTAYLKRIWFVVQGFRLRRLGVWYRAAWNRSAWHWEE